ncbi:MAG: DUF5011 domain-containing protein [Lachnospiraceae bacterium]|nr:DUF5011 domain-containing protein [Lachnospiraceae bacterium]
MIRRKKRRGQKRRGKKFLLFVSLLVLFYLGGFAYLQLRPKAAKVVTMEAGSPMADIGEFLKDQGKDARFITDINSLDLNRPGTYPIQIEIEGKVYNTSLRIVDTVPPKAVAVSYTAMKGETVAADSLVKDITDATEVSVSFKEAPDTSVIGDQEVTILLEDAGGNQTEMNAMLTVLDIMNSITIEAGSRQAITTADFISDPSYTVSFVTDISKLDISKPGMHIIQLDVNGTVKNAGIKVVDTIPPKAEAVDAETWLGEAVEPISFLSNIEDATEVRAFYVQEPDFTVLGEQRVTIQLKDEGNNTSEVEALLIVKEDTEAPVILGVRDKTVYIGDSLSYRKGITVTDNKDKEVELQIDSSSVNLKKEGTYSVTYTAVDSSGNKAAETAKITVKKLSISEDTLNELADEVLGRIVKAGMTQKEIAEKIYTWTKGHISYTGSSDKSDWMAEAYRGFKNGIGDCFTYFAVSQVLLNRAEIENIGLTREGGRTHHYWSLINCGEGWYHFDATPNKDHRDSFYLTESEAVKLTEIRGNNYYVYDKTSIDVTPEE